MKASTLLALTSIYLRRAGAAVHLPFAKQKTSSHETTTDLTRRSINAALSYSDAIYVVNVTVGTPGQPVSLQLSASSSDTWVVDARSTWCTSTYSYYGYGYEDDYNTTETQYCIWGTFSSGNSTSFNLLNPTGDESDIYDDFSTSYNDGSYAYGEYMSDVLTIGGMTVSNLTMGLVNDTSTYIGVLGIGYNDSTYDNLPNRLQEQGLINSTAYSIWVDDEVASSGNLLFGAIDTTKFEGNLTRLRSEYSYYQMMVRVVGINGSTSDSNGPVAITATSSDASESSTSYTTESSGDSYLFTAMFSPPDTLSVLPDDIASQIWQMAGAYYDDDLELAVISCLAASDTTTNFTLQLGSEGTKGPVISAYMSDLVIPADEFNLSSYYYYSSYANKDSNACLFGVQNGSSLSYSASSDYSLGSTLLRRTYTVFDLVNNEVAVAPVTFGASTTSNVVPFESYGASVPSSTTYCYYSSCYAETGTGVDGSSEETGTGAGLTGVLSVGALMGLSLGIAVGSLALGLAGFLFWRHRRSNAQAAKGAESGSSAEAGENAPMMSSTNGANETAPGMTESAQSPAVATAIGRGKTPEMSHSLPLPLSSAGGLREAPEAAGIGGAHDVDNGEGSSRRNA